MILSDAEAVPSEEEQEEVTGAEARRQIPYRTENLFLSRRVLKKLHLIVTRAVLEETVQVCRITYGTGEIRDVPICVLVNANE